MSFVRALVCGVSLFGGLAWSPQAAALEPLSRYLAAARQTSAEAKEAGARVNQRQADLRAARAGLFPSLDASASYTRNQYDVVELVPNGDGTSTEAPFTPRNQVDASVTLTVPLLDVAAVRRLQSAKAIHVSAQSDRDERTRALDDRIVAAYTRLLSYEALTQSSLRAVQVARTNLAVVQGRAAGGLASELDVGRARAQVAAAEQALAETELERPAARRELEALSGLPVAGPIPPPPGDLSPELPLERWIEGVEQTAAVARARMQVRASEASHRATRSDLIPRVVAQASERLTNAYGFGEPAQWSVGVKLTARFDVATIHRSQADRAAVAVSSAQYEQVRRDRGLEIANAYDRVESLRARARAARAEAEANATALEVANARYSGGTATQLEVVVAMRDAYDAEALRIQADGALMYARAQLRLASGRPLEGGP